MSHTHTQTMKVHFRPELEKKLNDLAALIGRPVDELLQDAVAGLIGDLAETRETLDRRYDDLKSGRVKPVDGEAFFESLRQREEELSSPRTP